VIEDRDVAFEVGNLKSGAAQPTQPHSLRMRDVAVRIQEQRLLSACAAQCNYRFRLSQGEVSDFRWLLCVLYSTTAQDVEAS
jgi:hypothetical protein